MDGDGPVPNWIRTSKRQLCPICGKPDGCLIEPSGEVVCCSRIESPILKGAPFVGGWIHKLTPDTKVTQPTRRRTERPVPKHEIQTMAVRYAEAMQDMDWLSGRLGVSAGSLERLQVGWSGSAFSFPMRNEHCVVTGITLRARDGKKWSVTGGTAGVYWPLGVEATSRDTLFLPEGPTDSSALLDIGCEAIGRYSNMAGLDILAGILQQRRRRLVVFVADNDEAKTRPDGTTWYPGIDGARALASKLKRLADCTKILMPPRHKDIRQWKATGTLSMDVLRVLLKGILPE